MRKCWDQHHRLRCEIKEVRNYWVIDDWDGRACVLGVEQPFCTERQAMSQRSFSTAEAGRKKKRTRRDIFLAGIERVAPLARLIALIEPVYPKSGRVGRPRTGVAGSQVRAISWLRRRAGP